MSGAVKIEPDIAQFRCGNCIGCFRETNCGKCPNCTTNSEPCLRRICVQSGILKAAPSRSSPAKTSSKKDGPRKAKAAKKTSIRKTKVKKNTSKATPRKSKKSSSGSDTRRYSETSTESKTPVQSPTSNPLSAAQPVIMKDEEIKKEIKEEDNSDTFASPEMPQSQTAGSNGGRVVKPRKPHKPHKPHVWKCKEQRMMLKMLKEKQEELELRQCLGPACVKYAKAASKYCSEQCGLNLANLRLCRTLPHRVQDFYNEKPMSELDADQRIQKLTTRKQAIEKCLIQCDSYSKNLDLYLSVLSQGSTAMPAPANDKNEDDASNMPLGCMVCGQDFPVKGLSKHVQKCFIKMEKQSSFGTKDKFMYNPNNILCEVFDKTSGTFCKRLRVICADHYKDQIGSQMKVCGYPYIWNPGKSNHIKDMFGNLESILSEGMCFAERKNCEKHLLWEQTAYALIDNEKMSLLLELDEITEAYRRLAEVYRTRGDAVTLLMNWRQIGHGKSLSKVAQIEQDLQMQRMIQQHQDEFAKEKTTTSAQQDRARDPTRPRRGRPPGQVNRKPPLNIRSPPRPPPSVHYVPRPIITKTVPANRIRNVPVGYEGQAEPYFTMFTDY